MSKEIIDAAASYFGMDPAHLAQGTMAAGANGLRFTFTVEVGADDYMGIADRMRAMREPAEQSGAYLHADGTYRYNDGTPVEPDPAFVQLPSLQEVMRNPTLYMGRPECADLVAKACGLSKSVRDQVEAECQRQIQEAQDSARATAEKIAAPPLSKAEREMLAAQGLAKDVAEYYNDPSLAELGSLREVPVIPLPGETMEEARKRLGWGEVPK